MRMRTLPAAPLAQLHADLASAGFTPGIPANLTLESRATDQELCRRMRCPSCRRRGLAYRPYSNGKKYRVIAGCPTCNAAEEV